MSQFQSVRTVIFGCYFIGLLLISSPLKAGLVGSYELNGNLNDTVTNTAGTGVNVSYIADRFGVASGAASLDGTSYFDAVDPTMLLNNHDYSVSLWANFSTVEPEQMILYQSGSSVSSRANRWSSALQLLADQIVLGNGKAQVGGVANFSAPGIIAVNNWHHLVATYDKSGFLGTGVIYLDGQSISTETATMPSLIFDRIDGFRFGGLTVGSSGFFQGAIDDVNIYDHTLSATDVSDIFQEQAAVVPEPSTYALIIIGLVGLGIIRRKRNRQISSSLVDFSKADQRNQLRTRG